MTSVDLVTLTVFLGALACAVCLAIVLGNGAGRRQKQRIDIIQKRWTGSPNQDVAAVDLIRGSEDGRLGNMALRFMPRRQVLRQRLMKAGLRMSPGQYALLSFALAAISGLAAKFLFGVSVLLAILAGIAIGIGVPHVFVSNAITRRLAKFNKLFPEAIDFMVRGIRSGLPVSETIASIGQELEDPVGIEFRRITDAVKLGQTLEEALWETARRLDTPEFKFFVISLSVQRETGGNLAETLENLSDILRKRQQLLLKIKAMSSEARASAYIIGSLPFIMFGILMLMNSAYVMKLLTDPRGLMMVGAGLVIMTIGGLVMAKMVKFEI